jgi:hypothetical protein
MSGMNALLARLLAYWRSQRRVRQRVAAAEPGQGLESWAPRGRERRFRWDAIDPEAVGSVLAAVAALPSVGALRGRAEQLERLGLGFIGAGMALMLDALEGDRRRLCGTVGGREVSAPCSGGADWPDR